MQIFFPRSMCLVEILVPYVFHFTELEKLRVFFLKPDLILKLHLLKPNTLLSMVKIMVVTMVVVCGRRLR